MKTRGEQQRRSKNSDKRGEQQQRGEIATAKGKMGKKWWEEESGARGYISKPANSIT